MITPDNISEYALDSRKQYLISLVPTQSFIEKLEKLLKKINVKDKNIKSNTLDLHTTILGFYSDYKKLDFDSIDLLDSELVHGFDSLDTLIKEPALIKNVATYGSKTVLELDSIELFKIHYNTIKLFKPFIVLKGGVLAKDNESYFNERYSYSCNNYSPHISLFDSSKDYSSNNFINSFINKSFYFNTVVLSKKEQGIWNNLSVLRI